MAKIGRQGDGGGRPIRVLTDEEVTQVEALASVLSLEQVADFIGISKVTFYEIMKRQPNVSERFKKGRAKAIGNVAKGLVRQAMDGNISAAIFYLKTQAGWREKEEVKEESNQTVKTLKIEFIGENESQ